MQKERRKPILVSPIGFTLIELAIGMAVIGIMLGGALLIVGKVWERDRREETRAYMQEVKQALLAYARVNGALPRDDWNNVDGIADDYGSMVFNVFPRLVIRFYAPGSIPHWLPYKTLQVPGKDAFGSQLLYHPHWRLTEDANIGLETSCKTLDWAIQPCIDNHFENYYTMTDRQVSCSTLDLYYKSGPLVKNSAKYIYWGDNGYGWEPMIRWKQNDPAAVPPIPDLAVAAVIVSGGERSLDGSSATKFESLPGGSFYYSMTNGYYPTYYEANRDDIFEYITIAELYNALGCSDAFTVEY